MNGAWTKAHLLALLALLLGGAGCVVGVILDERAFFPAWLAAFVFWMSAPLAAVTLVLVHDLTGGRWMASARPTLAAAAAMMPISTIAFLPILAGLGRLYVWSAPGTPGLGNAFYLNDSFFIVRYAIYFVLWNGAALWAVAAPRSGSLGVAPSLSWISAVLLLLLAFSVSFASFDWVMSLEPQFWSSMFGMLFGAAEFVTGLALLLLVLALRPPAAAAEAAWRGHVADLAAILLATTIFWAYAEFMQFLIIWEENLRSEIPWYLHRMAGAWDGVMYAIAAAGFFIPFFVLLWTPAKRNRAVVACTCALMVIAHLVHDWWLVLPEFPDSGFGWIDVAAFVALGGLWLLLFLLRAQYPLALTRRAARPAEGAQHG